MKITETWSGRCSDKVKGETAKFRRRSGATDECYNHASYLVDGKLKCTLHAQQDAFNHVLETSK